MLIMSMGVSSELKANLERGSYKLLLYLEWYPKAYSTAQFLRQAHVPSVSDRYFR